jgi:DNA-binding NarL/FixJ family response regulator
MIYLIDDNIIRQKDFGWTEDKFEKYKEFIRPLYTIDDVTNIKEDLYQNNNIILYHESFLDFTDDRVKAVEQRRKLSIMAESKEFSSIAYFSGSQSSRSLVKNIAHIPVSILYRNLEILIHQCMKNNSDLKYLLFGEKPEIEEELDKLLTEANKEIEDEPAIITGRNLFIKPNLRNIQNPIIGAVIKSLFNDVSDDKLSQKVAEWLGEEEYDNIFIPLCFGQILSDFNGLRLATHIRCTESPNQLKRILIYSFVGMEYLLQCEYFNILKSKGVELVDYSKKAFELAASQNISSIEIYELPLEIKKLGLQPPKNYQDNHSISNEWAIHQWAKTIGCDETSEIIKVFENIQANLYFKYLRTIYPVSRLDRISPVKLKFQYNTEPKVLLIDDEADKGWFDIFAYLLGDINNFYFDYLGVDFKKINKHEIIEKSIEKIISDDIDIVILDFRLNQSDFDNRSSEEITSITLLKKIKETNPGIQVIAFSATNKIWNLKALESEGANGFISKGGPNNNHSDFIIRSIEDFMQNIQECMRLSFLKDFYKDQYEISSDLIPRRKPKNEKSLPKDFIDEALKWLNLSNDILSVGYLNEAKIVSSFIFKFSVLENISTRIIDTDNPILVDKNERGINKYKFQFRLCERRLRNFVEDENNKGYYRKTKKVYESSRNIPWVIKILNTIDFITNESLNEEELTKLIKKRNDFIHANPTTGNKVSISIDNLKFLNHIITLGLKNIV